MPRLRSVRPFLLAGLMVWPGLGRLCPTASAQRLVVVNQADRNVSVIDSQSGRAVTIAEEVTGQWAHEAAVSADGSRVFLPIYGDSGVGKKGKDGREMLVVDLLLGKTVGRVDFGRGVRPHQPVLDPARGLLYVTTELDRTVTVIDAKSLKIVGAVPTGAEQSHMLALSRDGSLGYTANVGPGSVSVLDVVRRRTVAVIPVSGSVQRISISRDDRLVFTWDQTQPRLAVIDAKTQRVQSWVALPGTGYGTASTLDGRFLLVAVPGTDEVAVVDLEKRKVVQKISVPSTPQEVLMAPDGKTAFVSCNTSGKVAAIDLKTWKVSKLISAGGLADGLAWAR